MQGLEPPPGRDRPHHFALFPPVDHEGETLGSLVLVEFL
jgi:hypothetical protein